MRLKSQNDMMNDLTFSSKIQDHYFRCLKARIVCQRDGAAELFQHSSNIKVLVTTLSECHGEGDDEFVVVKQYEMTLPELIGWFEENRSRDPPEQIVEISRKQQGDTLTQ